MTNKPDTQLPPIPETQSPIDFDVITNQIIAADDGREPHERSRTNITNPSPDELLFMIDDMETRLTARLDMMRDKINEILSASFYGKLEKVEELE